VTALSPAGLGATDVARNLAIVRGRISNAGGDPRRITVVAVTKGFGPDVVQAAHDAGLADVGENYAQELVAKATALSSGSSGSHPGRVRWHFLGSIQRNKVAGLAPLVAVWQTVDRPVAGEAIAHRVPGAQVFVQVNIAREAAKHGCALEDTPDLVDRLRALDLDVRGLMAIGPSGPPELARPGFRALARLARRLELRELSMGMTDDLEVAVQEGATMVRIGRALFGPRPGTPRLRR
jgi:pyridoxal phosphate enzyme (YggS family)